MSDDVVVPRAVEHKIRELHPPEEHDARIEEARGYYRVLREDRKKELQALRTPTAVDPDEVQPTPAQQQKILVRKRRKKFRKRKVTINPGWGPGRPIKPPPQEGQVDTPPASVEKSFRLPDKSIVRFRTTVAPKPDTPRMFVADVNRDIVSARRRGKEIGYLGLERHPKQVLTETQPGTVGYITVEQKYRRQGIATKMLEHAKRKGLDPKDSPSKTNAGKALSESLVGKSIRLPDKSIVRLRTYRYGPGTLSRVEAMREQKNIGYLLVGNTPGHAQHGQVAHVKVKKKYRRKGIADEMWQKAKSTGMEPKHSENQTQRGKRWALAVGD